MTARQRKSQAKRRRHYRMRRPITTYDQALEEGEAWGEYHAGNGPKPTTNHWWFPIKPLELLVLGVVLGAGELVVALWQGWL